MILSYIDKTNCKRLVLSLKSYNINTGKIQSVNDCYLEYEKTTPFFLPTPLPLCNMSFKNEYIYFAKNNVLFRISIKGFITGFNLGASAKKKHFSRICRIHLKF